jgi:DNA-binding response OmpR family regulator
MIERFRILVVEDDALQRTLLAELLTVVGHDVCGTAATETEAVAAALRDLPDLMLVDRHLQSGSGVSAMNAILRQTAMPHIYMSGSSRSDLPANAIVLQKPFGMGDLRDALDCMMRQIAAIDPVQTPRVSSFGAFRRPGPGPI